MSIRPADDIHAGDWAYSPSNELMFCLTEDEARAGADGRQRILTPSEVKALPKGAWVTPLRNGTKSKAFIPHCWEGDVHPSITDNAWEMRYALISLPEPEDNNNVILAQAVHEATRQCDALIQSLHKLKYQLAKNEDVPF